MFDTRPVPSRECSEQRFHRVETLRSWAHGEYNEVNRRCHTQTPDPQGQSVFQVVLGIKPILGTLVIPALAGSDGWNPIIAPVPEPSMLCWLWVLTLLLGSVRGVGI